jgi:hypothetical protein
LRCVVCNSLRGLERLDVSRPRPCLRLAYRQSGEIIGANLKDLGRDVAVPASKDLWLGAVCHESSIVRLEVNEIDRLTFDVSTEHIEVVS